MVAVRALRDLPRRQPEHHLTRSHPAWHKQIRPDRVCRRDPGKTVTVTEFAHPAALTGPPIRWDALRRLLVVRPDNLGDVLLAGPAVAALRTAAPRARLDLLASPAGAPGAALLPEVDAVVVARVSWQQIETTAEPPDTDLVARLAAEHYDAAVVLTSFSQSPWPAGYVLQRAGIPVRAGMSKEFGGTGLTHWAPAPDDGLHQVDRALHLLAVLGVPVDDRAFPPRLHAMVAEQARAAAAAALQARGITPDAPYAVVLPGASCPARRWSAERFRAAAGLLARQGLPVVVVGPPTEKELVDVVTAGVAGATALVGALDVAGLAGLLAGASVAVTNNSGGMHLADAVGTPVVALFSGTEDEAQYRPRSVPAVLLRVPTWCSPCHQFHCPFALECLDVAPEEVAAAALRLAAGEGAPRSGVPDVAATGR
jgi:ADP-heptose:LPS heptosyltransferase